jgi:hypothetical protein
VTGAKWTYKPHGCEKCNGEWDGASTADNDYLCTKRCGGALVPVESTPRLPAIDRIMIIPVHLRNVEVAFSTTNIFLVRTQGF